MATERLVPGGAYVNETATAQRLVPGGAYVNETVAAAPGAAAGGGAHGAMYPRMQRHIHQSWTMPRVG